MVQPLYQGALTTSFGKAGSQLDQDNDFGNLGVFTLSSGEGGSLQAQLHRQELLKFDIRKKFFTVGMTRHKLLRDVVDTSSLEKLKFKLHRALDNQVWVELHLGRSFLSQIIL